MGHYGWIPGIIIVGLLLYFVGLPLCEAWYETLKAPRVDMYVCHRHGPVPKHLCITFKDKDDKSPLTEQEYQCPFCYEDAFGAAAKHFAEKERIRVS